MPGSAASFVPMPTDGDTAVTDDAVLDGRLRLLQPRRGHRVGHDAILLAAATGGEAREHAVELGAGVGAAGLALASRVPGLTVTLVEIDPSLVALAAENASRNGLAERVRSVGLDVGGGARAFAAAGLAAGAANRVLMNPPFHDPARHNASPDPRRRLAHLAGSELDPWVRCAARLLRPGGMLTLIWRADGLPDVLGALGARFGAITVLPVHPRPDAAAIRILVRAQEGSRMPLSLLPGLSLHDAAGRPSAAAEDVLRGAAALPLASR
jgi:tRNA1(Val) A37 N6-methylase TrmN6